MANETLGVLAFAIILILILIIIIEFWVEVKREKNSKIYGKWGKEIRTECRGFSNLCNQGGTQDIIKPCIPNPKTGLGCINSKGVQTYDSDIKTVKCQPECRKSVWVDVSDDICLSGVKNKILKCVKNDSNGSNNCTTTEITKYIGPGGVIGSYPQFETYQIGDTFSHLEQCSDYTEYNNSYCDFNKALVYSNVCQINNKNNSNDDIFETLKEGYLLIEDENSVSTTLNLAKRIRRGELIEKELKENKICIRACRLFPGVKTLGFEEFDSLLNNYLLLRIPNLGYLTTLHIPSKSKNGIRFKNTKDRPADKLNNVPFQLVRYDQTIKNCTNEEIEFTTAVLFILGVRNYKHNILQTQMMATVGDSYHGWSGIDSNNILIWRQALIHYGGFGITTDEADIFTIEPLSGFSYKKYEGFPTKMKGIINVKITKNGKSIYVKDSSLNKYSLDKVEVVIFDSQTDIKERGNRNRDNCNLHF